MATKRGVEHNSSLPANTQYSSSPYSASALGRAIKDNAGLLFIGLSILIIGFMAGSLWTENAFLKKGYNGVAGGGGNGGTGTNGTADAQQQGQQVAPSPTPLSDADWKTVTEGGAYTIGNQNAKVTMAEFTDYQCPFCGQFFNQSYGQLKQQYIDTGKVKVVVHDQPLTIHPNSRIGALAARCSGDQGKYEQMHDMLFKNQNDWVNLARDAAIKKYGDYATQIGINADSLMSCVQSEKFGKQIDDDIALANRVGANGTPTFFVDKNMIVGAQPTNVFQAALDAALQK